MSLTRSALLVAGAALYLTLPPTPLHVLRVAPTSDAERNATIAVTFDRPVAGSLDRTVDPRRIVRVEPAVDARIEWRDPVTITIVPHALLRADKDTQYSNVSDVMTSCASAGISKVSFATITSGAKAHPGAATPAPAQ